MFRLILGLGGMCSSLYFLPPLVEKLHAGPGGRDELLQKYLPPEAKAQLDQLDDLKKQAMIQTDKGNLVPGNFVQVTPAAEAKPAKKKVISTGKSKNSGSKARIVRGGG